MDPYGSGSCHANYAPSAACRSGDLKLVMDPLLLSSDDDPIIVPIRLPKHEIPSTSSPEIPLSSPPVPEIIPTSPASRAAVAPARPPPAISHMLEAASRLYQKSIEVAQGYAGVQELDELMQTLNNTYEVLTPESLEPTLFIYSSSPASFFLRDDTPGAVSTFQYVFNSVYDKFIALHEQNPHHPIFGERQAGKIRLPFTGTGRNRFDWEAKCLALARSIEEAMGAWIMPNSCWMKVDPVWHITMRDPQTKKPITLVQFQITRLLAFINNPTTEGWAALAGQLDKSGRSIDTPFTHFCHNGYGSKGGPIAGVAACVNGIEHGRFATAKENVDQKDCRFSDRSRCPGHGTPPAFCIFVDPDTGLPRPCLNQVDGRPPECFCREEGFCNRRCF